MPFPHPPGVSRLAIDVKIFADDADRCLPCGRVGGGTVMANREAVGLSGLGGMEVVERCPEQQEEASCSHDVVQLLFATSLM